MSSTWETTLRWSGGVEEEVRRSGGQEVRRSGEEEKGSKRLGVEESESKSEE